METRRFDSPCYFGPSLRLILMVNSAFFVISLIFWIHFYFEKEELQGVKLVYKEDIILQRIKNGEQIIQKLIQENKALQSNVQICKKRNNKLTWKKFETMKNNNQSIQEIVRKLNISDRLESRQKKIPLFLSYVSASLRNTPYPGVENYTLYATSRLGLSSLSEGKSLNPDFGPVINDVLSFKYSISISPCKDSNNSSVFVAIISAPPNFQKRNVIRKTWKNHLETVLREGLVDLAGFGFILGVTENNLTQRAIDEESKTYEDIIQIEISDFYRNLSLKVAGLFNWLNRMCTKVGFVLKVDDDVYINVRNLANFLRSHHQFNHSVFGVGDPAGGWPDRDGKWEITFEEWPWNNYPRYFLGATVLMHGSTIVPFLAACQTTPMIPFDDLYIFGMCSEKANINLRYSSGSTSVLLGLILWIPTSCELRNLIAWRLNSENIVTFKENMEISHAKVNQFYHNITHCIISDGYNGINAVVPQNVLNFSESKSFDNAAQKNDENFNRNPSYPWIGDPQCQNFSVQLAEKDSLPKWPLTSFPGSGVTWTRQMIEGVTGIYTGSVYFGDPPPTLSQGKEMKNTDDPICGCTIVDKDHEATVQVGQQGLANYFEFLHRLGHAGIVHQQYDKRGILLLRNPMDVVFTYRHWLQEGKIGNAPLEAFQGRQWEEVVHYVAYAWADHAIRWIEQIEHGTVLFYERLMGKTAEKELRRLLKSINFEPIDSDRMRCTLSHRNRTDHKRNNKKRMFLEPKHRIELMKSIHKVQQSLRRKGWPRLPVYMYDIHSPDGNL